MIFVLYLFVYSLSIRVQNLDRNSGQIVAEKNKKIAFSVPFKFSRNRFVVTAEQSHPSQMAGYNKLTQSGLIDAVIPAGFCRGDRNGAIPTATVGWVRREAP